MGQPNLIRHATRLTHLKMTRFDPRPIRPTNLINLARTTHFATSTCLVNSQVIPDHTSQHNYPLITYGPMIMIIDLLDFVKKTLLKKICLIVLRKS